MTRTRLFYGWIVVLVTVPVLMVAAGMRAAPGAWLVPMRLDLGWSIASLSFAGAIGMLVFGFSGPVAGAWIQRFGIRPVVGGSLLVSALAMAVSSQLQTQWQLYLVFGLLSGLATGMVGSVLGAVVSNRWFIRHRGLVVGMMGAATSAGQLVFFPLLTGWAVSFGWRTAALLLAGACLVLIPPFLLLMRGLPAQLGLEPLGGTALNRPPPARPAREIMAVALRSPVFWLLCATFFVCGATSSGLVGQHFIPHSVDHGFSEMTAAGTLAIIGAFNFVGTIASGWLTDRFDPRKLLLAYYVLRGLSLLALPFIQDHAGMLFFAVLFGLDYIATVPPTIALAADTFGRNNAGVVYGWVFASHQVGAFVAAWGAGLLRDSLGDYAMAFFIAGGLAVIAGLMALLIRRTAPASAAPSPA